MSEKTATLRINCADAKGIVYTVSKFIFEHGGNIIDAQQHTEELDSRFFMRVHFDYSDMALSRDELRANLEQMAQEHDMETALAFCDIKKRIAIMVSKYDHCLYDLFLRDRYGEIDADIAVVVSNHADLQSVAANFNVPFYHIPVARETKEEAERRAIEVFQQYKVDFVVLARYMQILTPLLVNAYRNRIINVHHGFLPAFKGARPYHQAYERGVKLIGASSHYVTEALDMGPLIAQETIRVNHSHSVKDLSSMGRDIEKRVLAAAVRGHAEDKLMVYKARTIVFD